MSTDFDLEPDFGECECCGRPIHLDDRFCLSCQQGEDDARAAQDGSTEGWSC